jgi:MFS superfamily sulfate permease-like transporter
MSDATLSSRLTQDGPASLVVYLVALPLCLGIAPRFGSTAIRRHRLRHRGRCCRRPALRLPGERQRTGCRLAVICLTAIQKIGTYEGFLLTVVLSGLFQLAFSVMRLGVIADYVPNAVIKGMLAGIGLLIIIKQIPHPLGRDNDFMGDFKFLEAGGNTMLSDIASAVASATAGPTIIFMLSLILMLAWDKAGKHSHVSQLVPGPLGVVAMGIALNQMFASLAPSLHVADVKHLVNLPVPESVTASFHQFALPDFSLISNKVVWTTAMMPPGSKIDDIYTFQWDEA